MGDVKRYLVLIAYPCRRLAGIDAQTRNAFIEEPGSCPRMPSKEERLREMPGKPSRRPRKPEQGAHRRAQVSQRPLLQ